MFAFSSMTQTFQYLKMCLVVIIMARYKDSVSTTVHPTQAQVIVLKILLNKDSQCPVLSESEGYCS